MVKWWIDRHFNSADLKKIKVRKFFYVSSCNSPVPNGLLNAYEKHDWRHAVVHTFWVLSTWSEDHWSSSNENREHCLFQKENGIITPSPFERKHVGSFFFDITLPSCPKMCELYKDTMHYHKWFSYQSIDLGLQLNFHLKCRYLILSLGDLLQKSSILLFMQKTDQKMRLNYEPFYVYDPLLYCKKCSSVD